MRAVKYRWVEEWRCYVPVYEPVKQVPLDPGPTEPWIAPHHLTCTDIDCLDCWNRQVHAEHDREVADSVMHPLGI